MRSLVALSAVALFVGAAPLAAQPSTSTDAAPAADRPLSENERAGLPNLDAINGTAAQKAGAQAKLDLNVPRTPSFYLKERSGTVIEEYRDRGKPVEIDVHSNFGTHYRMSAPADISPRVQNQGVPTERLPSVNIPY